MNIEPISLTLFLAIALGFTAISNGQSEPRNAAFIQRLEAGHKITLVTMGSCRGDWPDVMIAGWLGRDYAGQVTYYNEDVEGSASSVGPGNDPDLSGLGKLPAVLAHQPDVVFIEFATNDAYLPYQITVEDSKNNLNTLIDRIQAENPQIEIILQTMIPVKDRPAHGTSGAATQRPRLAEYVEGYRQVAKARGLRLVDHFAIWQKLMMDDPAVYDQFTPDGIHPAADACWGYMLTEIRRALMPPPPDGPVCYLQNPTERGMTVCVLAPSVSTREVSVTLAADDGTATREQPAQPTAIPDTAWTIWKIRLTELNPGTRYRYHVNFRFKENLAATPVYHFRTLDPHGHSLRFVTFNDVHMKHTLMGVLLKQVKPEDYDFSLLLGDVFEGFYKDGSDVIQEWIQYIGLLDGADKPILFVRGNHDVRQAFAKRLAYLFDLPNLDPTQPWGAEQWNYTLQAGPVSLLMLDTGEDDDGTTPTTSYKNPVLWNKVRQREADWLQQVVPSAALTSTPWRVLCSHIPLYNSPWTSAPSRTLWTPVLQKWKPDLALAGHDHTWRPATPIPAGVPWPSLVGGGPAKCGGEEATMMVIAADPQMLRVRLIGAKDGRKLTEFSATKAPKPDVLGHISP